MKTSAPELRALIIILRSVGPVISTWRRSQVGRRGGHPPVAGALGGGLGEEVEGGAGVELGLALGAAAQQVGAAGAEFALEMGDEGQGVGGQHRRRG